MIDQRPLMQKYDLPPLTPSFDCLIIAYELIGAISAIYAII